MDEAVRAHAVHSQFNDVLSDREIAIIGKGVMAFNAGKLDPNMALALWAQLAALSDIEKVLARNVMQAIHEVDLEIKDAG